MQFVPDFRNNKNHYSFWLKWLCSLIFISFFFIITIGNTPYLHKDETTTIELGRNTLHPDSDWSVAWLMSKNKPVLTCFYIGPVLQEFSYNTFGEYGPRMMSLIGAFVAATAAVGWLLAYGITKINAFLLGIIFMLDPLFVQSYTIARIDCWAIALCFCACWILRSNKSNLHLNGQIVVAGILLTIGTFIWPSAIFLFPIIILELISLIKNKVVTHKFRSLFKAFLLLFTTCFIATILILIPIISEVFNSIQNVLEGLKLNLISAPKSTDHAIPPNLFEKSIELLRILKFSPFLPVLALFTIITRKNIGLFIAGMGITILLISTVVYMHRVLYMVPYFVFVVAHLYTINETERYKPIKYWILKGSLTLLLVWSVGLTLIARTVFSIIEKEDGKREQINLAAQQLIGKGRYNVFLWATEFYYAGRSLGWKMHTPYLALDDALTFETIKTFLPHMDYFIIMERLMTKEFADGLKEAGMSDQGIHSLYVDTHVDDFKTDNIRRLRNLYHIHIQPYGPYRIFVRHQKPLITTLHKNN